MATDVNVAVSLLTETLVIYHCLWHGVSKAKTTMSFSFHLWAQTVDRCHTKSSHLACPNCRFSYCASSLADLHVFDPAIQTWKDLSAPAAAEPPSARWGKALLRWGAGSTCMEALVVKVRWRAFCNYLRNGLICWHMKMYSAYSVVYYIERESMRNILASGKCLCKIWSCKCQWKVSISTYSIFLIME